MVRAFAPGRVNLIGDHTDYTGGLVLPMAVQLGTTVEVDVGGDEVRLDSADEPEPVVVPLDPGDPAAVEPRWGRYVAGVVAEVRPSVGATGTVTTTLPVGAGLSSSAALEVAVALALGFVGTPLELALACQRAEQRASGVPCGVMDQLTSAAGVAGHALLIDCTTLEVSPVPVPDGLEVVAVHSGQPRTLAGSAYAERRAACEGAVAVIGPLRDASLADLDDLDDPVVRRRARHVISENGRVRAAAVALAQGDAIGVGALMDESHASLRDDFEVSTPALDALVERLRGTPGVFGARLTGAGFGGCAVALCEPGALTEGWRLEAVDGARRTA
ncbi:MAG TPA: galactokinase [Acidimicrobiales bacterium]|nr:galactokinase [Acidimicrobiales bacterium]